VYFFKAITTDDMIAVAPFGVFGRQAIIALVEKKQGIHYKNARMENPRVLALSGDSALVTYKVTIKALVQGKDLAIPRNATLVYVKSRGSGSWHSASRRICPADKITLQLFSTSFLIFLALLATWRPWRA
jgi:ketosteroid isomerase-like protein